MSWFGTIRGRVGYALPHIPPAIVNNPPGVLAAAVSAILMTSWAPTPLPPTQFAKVTVGAPPVVVTAPTSYQPIGANVNNGTNLMFLNIMKEANGWTTANNSGSSTNEAGYLNLDSDGYAKSLTANPVPSSGQQFTQIYTLLNGSLSTPPGASYPYPPGSYTLQFTGIGTGNLGFDAANLVSTSSGLTVNGSSFTSTSTGVVTLTFNVGTPTNGIHLYITALPDSVNYIRAISVVQTSLMSSFNAGAIFHPYYLRAVSGISRLRFLDWLRTNNEFFAIQNSANSIPAGSTSVTLTSAWTDAGQTKTIYFDNGEQHVGTFTTGSPTVAWSTALSTASSCQIPGRADAPAVLSWHDTWSKRTLPSNCFWNVDHSTGLPYEIIIALCNTVGADLHLNVPMWCPYSYYTSLLQLIYSGTGAQSGFGKLNAPLKLLTEVGNENWNYGGGGNAQHAALLGSFLFPGTSAGGTGGTSWRVNYHGTQSAIVAEICSTVFGADFASRCVPALGSQAANVSGEVGGSMPTPYWTSPINGYVGPASAHPLKAVVVAPYLPCNPSTADCVTILGQSDGGLSYLYQCFTTNTMSDGTVLSSVPANGWQGTVNGWQSSGVSYLASNYPSLILNGYEGGQSFESNSGLSSSQATAYNALCKTVNRDARMGAIYTNFMNQWKTLVGATGSNMNMLFNDVYLTAGNNGFCWGYLESIMQLVDSSGNYLPLSGTPAKYQAVKAYIGIGT